MVNKMDYEPCPGGCRVTRIVTTDRDVVVPETIDGMAVVSLGPAVMVGSPHADNRSLSIPGTVASADPEALSGVRGIVKVVYGGGFETINNFRLTAESDCLLECADGFSFMFYGEHPMSFPAFDESLMNSNYRITSEIAAERLRNPVHLTETARAKYERVLSAVLMPRMEQAVSKGDARSLSEMLSTGMVSDDDVRRLLERSLRSGKTGVTSMLMSEIRRRAGIGRH